MNKEWAFHDNYIIHVPCKKKAFRFHGTHGKIWCNKCSARCPEEIESIADFVYEPEDIEPMRFYTSVFTISYFYNSFPRPNVRYNKVNDK